MDQKLIALLPLITIQRTASTLVEDVLLTVFEDLEARGALKFYGSTLSFQFYEEFRMSEMLGCLGGAVYFLSYQVIGSIFLASLWASAMEAFRGTLLTNLCKDGSVALF